MRRPIRRAPGPPALMRWRSQWRQRRLALMGFRARRVAAGATHLRVFVRGRPTASRCPTWVFVHGFADEATGWAPLLAHLASALGPQVVLDLPGHGGSPRPPTGLQLDEMMVALATALHEVVGAAAEVVLCGNSMGGVGALRLAQIFGQRARGLVLISPAGAPMSALELREIVELFTLDSAAKARAFIQRLAPVHPWMLATFASQARAHMTQPAFVELLGTFGRARWLTAGELAAMPETLLIWGRRDTLLPASGLAWMRAHLPAERTRIETPQDWGHVPFIERPGDVAAMILDWAASLDGVLPGPALARWPGW